VISTARVPAVRSLQITYCRTHLAPYYCSKVRKILISTLRALLYVLYILPQQDGKEAAVLSYTTKAVKY
jgi:hypothetical protein